MPITNLLSTLRPISQGDNDKLTSENDGLYAQMRANQLLRDRAIAAEVAAGADWITASWNHRDKFPRREREVIEKEFRELNQPKTWVNQEVEGRNVLSNKLTGDLKGMPGSLTPMNRVSLNRVKDNPKSSLETVKAADDALGIRPPVSLEDLPPEAQSAVIAKFPRAFGGGGAQPVQPTAPTEIVIVEMVNPKGQKVKVPSNRVEEMKAKGYR